MKLPSELSTFCIHETFSSQWRAREAREIFSLFREEYSKSKRLSIFKRYREIERIIKMFTSEQVVQKLMYLTRDKVEEDIKNIERKMSICSYDKSGLGNEPILEDDDDLVELDSVFDEPGDEETTDVQRTFVDKVVRSISVIFRKRSEYPSLGSSGDFSTFNSDLPTPVSPGFESLPGDGAKPIFFVGSSKHSTKNNSTGSIAHSPPICFSPTDSNIENINFLFPSVSNSSSDTSPNLNTKNKHMGSTFSAISTSGSCTTANNRYNTKTSWSRLHNKQTTTSNCQPSAARCKTRRGIEQYAIRSDQIPAFQIPPQRKPQGSGTHLSVSACKKESDSTPSTPRPRRFCAGELKANVSFPNLSPQLGLDYSSLAPLECFETPRRRLGLCNSSNYSPLPTRPVKQRSKSDHLFLVSPKVHQEEDFFPTEYKRRKISYAKCTDELDELFISSAYSHLLQLKSEFEKLPGKCMLSRYKPMKMMIKRCLELSFDRTIPSK